jgi:hypothetical protein
MKNLKAMTFVALASVLVGLPIAACAAAPAINSWSGSSAYTGGSWTIGDQFVANDNLSVSSLGVYDPNGKAIAPETVSLWTDSGTLIASAVVDSTGTLQGDFRYESLASAISLTAGQTYRIAVGVENAPWLYGVSGVITDPEIRYTTGVWENGQNVFPDQGTGGSGYISANFLIGATAVPEPTPVAMIALALLAAGVARRKFR